MYVSCLHSNATLLLFHMYVYLSSDIKTSTQYDITYQYQQNDEEKLPLTEP